LLKVIKGRVLNLLCRHPSPHLHVISAVLADERLLQLLLERVSRAGQS
jgi:hypothetical protein